MDTRRHAGDLIDLERDQTDRIYFSKRATEEAHYRAVPQSKSERDDAASHLHDCEGKSRREDQFRAALDSYIGEYRMHLAVTVGKPDSVIQRAGFVHLPRFGEWISGRLREGATATLLTDVLRHLGLGFRRSALNSIVVEEPRGVANRRIIGSRQTSGVGVARDIEISIHHRPGVSMAALSPNEWDHWQEYVDWRIHLAP